LISNLKKPQRFRGILILKILIKIKFASARFAFAVAGFGFDIFDFPLARTEGFRGIFDFQNSTYIKRAARWSRSGGRRALCGNR